MALSEKEESSFDATDFIPLHEGPNVLPNEHLFHAIHHWAYSADSLAVRDGDRGFRVTYKQLLSDVLCCVTGLRSQLHPITIGLLRSDHEVCICVWSEGYEFVVAFLAVLALGAVAVPLSAKVTIPEATYIAKTSRAHGILVNNQYLDSAIKLSKSEDLETIFKIVSSRQYCLSPIIAPTSVVFCASRLPDQSKSAIVIFTSGSTGDPKAAAMRRYNVYGYSVHQMRKHGYSEKTINLQLLPLHHGSGLFVYTLPVLLAGGCVEFMAGPFDPARVFNRLISGDYHHIGLVPTMYVRLVEHWNTRIEQLPQREKESYSLALSKIRDYHSSTSALPRVVAETWRRITNGRQILERYGGTEFSSTFGCWPGDEVTLGSVGTKTPGVDVRLSDGDEGEILVRGPYMFAKYLNDPEATQKVFNEEGYFKTGDIARRVKDKYFILGRSSIDIIKSGGYKISVIDIENAITKLPKVAEAMVVGVEDVEYGQRIAAAVVLKNKSDTYTIGEFRRDLKESLSNYKLPTILRVVPGLERTAMMKVPKAALKVKLFDTDHPDIQRWGTSRAVKL